MTRLHHIATTEINSAVTDRNTGMFSNKFSLRRALLGVPSTCCLPHCPEVGCCLNFYKIEGLDRSICIKIKDLQLL